jgi:hypothetical protein
MILATEQISHYLTKGEIFTYPRLWVLKKNDLLGQLAHCFECVSFWVALLLVCIVQPFDFWGWNVATLFAILVPAALVNGMRSKLAGDDVKRLGPPTGM